MGLFGNKKTEEEIREEALEECNIFEGVQCRVVFPDTQLRIVTHSGAVRGAATLAFGLVGLAATSSIKQNEEKRMLITFLQVVEKGIVFKNATRNNKDLRIPYENIVKVEHRTDTPKSTVFITLLENQEIEVTISHSLILLHDDYVAAHLIDILNQRICGAQYEEAGWGLEHATNESTEPKTTQESSSLMDELERLANLYEKGLLTDEEFAAMKKKLIEE